MKYIKYLIFIVISICINVYADTTYVKGTILKGVSEVSVRSCASTSCSVMKSDTNKGMYLSYPETFEIIGEENNFYKIRFQYTGFMYEGYISKGSSSKDYVKREEFIVKDSLIDSYVNDGFPRSYAEKLAILKSIHPNWEFVPFVVNASFDEVVAGETKYVNTNLIDGTNTSLRSTEDGAYADGSWITFEGGWYAASKQTVRFYLDPRNFLNDGHVFMFEELAFKEDVHTEELIQTILNGTFMEGACYYYDDNNEKIEISYAKTFRESGMVNGVSSVHLAARVIQEQGSKGSALSSGDNSSYPGYYNFFNVGATGKTDQDIINSGLLYAKNKNWNSPYASIIGGGNILSNYVTKYHQSTIYLQKFDLAGDTYYSTQYQQNVRAPYTESYSAYKSYYDNDLIDSKFLFSIPVFKGDMPEYTSLDVNYNEDNTLASLSVSGCNLMPSFTSSATNYSCNLNKDIASITVSASATNSLASVSGTGNYELTEDTSKISVVVTSASGNIKTYEIIINRVDNVTYTPDEILSKLQFNIKNSYLSGLDYQTDATSLINLINASYPDVSVSVSENKVLSTGMSLNLKSDGEKSYTLIVYGDNNGDGNIDIVDLLKVQKHILGVSQLGDGYKEASDVNKDGVVDIVDLLKIQKHILGVNKIEQ